MNNYDLSIIIPVYNGEKHIERCIKSIIEQKSDFTEVIIINDGSTDNTLKICENFAQKYNNIKLIKQENKGVSYSRNIGIQNSNGKYVMFVDSDDYLEKDSLEAVKQLLTKDFDVIRFSYIINNKKEVIFSEETFDIYKFFKQTNQNMIWGQVIKRELLKDIRFNENIFYGEDLLFNCQLYAKCQNIIYTDIILYNYTQNVDSVSRNYRNAKVKCKIENLIYVFNEIISSYKEKKLVKVIENKFIGEVVPQIMMLTFEKKFDKQLVLEQFKNILNENIFEKVFKDIDENQLTICRYKKAYKFMKQKEIKKLYLYAKIYKMLKTTKHLLTK